MLRTLQKGVRFIASELLLLQNLCSGAVFGVCVCAQDGFCNPGLLPGQGVLAQRMDSVIQDFSLGRVCCSSPAEEPGWAHLNQSWLSWDRREGQDWVWWGARDGFGGDL